MALCRGLAPFPTCEVHVLIRAQNGLVSRSTSDDPQLVNIDCTGEGFQRLRYLPTALTSIISPFMALR